MSRISPPESSERQLALDGLRGLAILLVLLVHLFRFEPTNVVWVWLTNLSRSGWLGVDLFFCLSGFLITRLLIAHEQSPHRYRDFYARRALRILPAYFAYLLVVLLLTKREISGDWLLSFLLFFQNFAIIENQGLTPWRDLNHLWSIAVEEQFYLFWPLVIYLVPARWRMMLCVGCIGAAWLTKLLLLQQAWPYGFYFSPIARMDALTAGAMGAVISSRSQDFTAFWRGLGPSTLALLAVFLGLFIAYRGIGLYRPHLAAFATSLGAVTFSALVLAASQPQRYPLLYKGLSIRPLLFLGRYSYGLYLVHNAWAEAAQEPLRTWLLPQLPSANVAVLISGAIVALLAIGNAVVMYHLLEVPILRLRRHFVPQSTQQTA